MTKGNTTSKLPSANANGKIDPATEYVVTAPDVFWPHTAPGRTHGTPDGVPVRFVENDRVTRADLPVDDRAVRTMLEHDLIVPAPAIDAED